MIKEGNYGKIIVVGQHPFAGQIGYYDDDDHDSTKAIVYFGTPFKSEYFLISRRNLRSYNGPFLPFDRWIQEHQELANHMGVYDRPQEEQ